jgi:hypothetical protein
MQTKPTFFKNSFLIVALLSCACSMLCAQHRRGLPINQLLLPEKSYQVKFQWQGDSMRSQWESYAAMLLPVTLPHCPRQFYMQFDLGSPYSLFYNTALQEIQSKYPKTKLLTDSTATLKNFVFDVGNIPVAATEIMVKQFSSPKINWSEKKGMDIIGTIGADLIDGRVILIDYPQRKITIGPNIPPGLKPDIELSDFVYAGKSVLLPAVIKGKQTVLFFDTGSSAYELLTDKKTFESLSVSTATSLQYKVNSWDRVLTAHTNASKDSVRISVQNIPINSVTYIEGASSAQVEQMMKMGIGGMTGNKLFINYRLLLDTKNKKFGVLNRLND